MKAYGCINYFSGPGEIGLSAAESVSGD